MGVKEEEIKQIDYNKDGGKFERYMKENLGKSPEQMEEMVGMKIRLEKGESTKDEVKKILGECYEGIIEVLKDYSDLREDYYDLVALWIIGSYLHEEFETYPYLFINAMRGSGKTRLLKLISALAKNGELLMSLRESVLFRDSKGKTLCIDECESIGSKENASLRELLNAGYKKGMKIKRMKKKRSMLGEEWESEEFEPYTAIAMANIWGMEEVLSDRCVTLILEKSGDDRITRLMEDFVHSDIVKNIKHLLNLDLVQLCSYFSGGIHIREWNKYINERYKGNTTIYTTTFTTLTTLNTLTSPRETNKSSVINDDNSVVLGDKKQKLHQLKLFNSIHDTGVNGRNLELMFPLFLIADFIGEEVFNGIIKIAMDLTKEKKEEEMVESRDVMFIDFVSQSEFSFDFTPVRDLTNKFKEFVCEEIEEQKWITSKWVGRALKRLSLIVDKRRVSKGVEVIVDIKKAKEKMKLFKK